MAESNLHTPFLVRPVCALVARQRAGRSNGRRVQKSAAAGVLSTAGVAGPADVGEAVQRRARICVGRW